MDWRTARGELASTLGAISITAPIVQTVKRVYQTPPATIQDVPCFVIYPPAVSVERPMGSLRIKVYTVRCRLFVLDADLDVAADIGDAYREALIAAIDGAVTLAGNVTGVMGQEIEEMGSFTYPEGGRRYTGFDCLLKLEMKESATFGL